MTESGEIHASWSTLTGPRASAVASFIDDVVDVPTLQKIAREYLTTLGN